MSASPNRPVGISAPDIIAAAIALTFGAYALYEARTMSDLGAVFPVTAAIVLIAGATAILALGFMRPANRQTAPPTEWKRFAYAVITLFAWAVLLKPLGFVITSALGMLAITLAARREPMAAKAAVHALNGIILIGAFYAVMRYLLKIAVP